MNTFQPFSEIPSAVLWEILGRVPIKTCLTCKLVCKEWYHAIVSPKFSSFRSNCNASRVTLLFHNCFSGGGAELLVFNFVEIDKTLDVDESSKCIVDLDHLIRVTPKIDTTTKIWYVSSPCNGVVCFTNLFEDYFVCNLLMCQCVKLQNLHELNNESCYISAYELGCCPVSGQFKVLALLSGAENVLLAKIQTVGSGEWRNLGNAPFKTPIFGCFLNWSSHWCGDNCIWCFHYGNELFSQIPFPEEVTTEAYKKKHKILSVFDSCLCLSCYSPWPWDGFGIDVWIMKEYGVKDSWVRQFTALHDDCDVPLVPLDKEKILGTSGNEVLLLDPQFQICKRVNFEPNELCDTSMAVAVSDANFSSF